jgi:hypothetical protein
MQALPVGEPSITLILVERPIYQSSQRRIVSKVAQRVDEWPVNLPPNQLRRLSARITPARPSAHRRAISTDQAQARPKLICADFERRPSHGPEDCPSDRDSTVTFVWYRPSQKAWMQPPVPGAH